MIDRPWIQTFSGVKFNPLDPDPKDILIDDIAHALARQCRFSGHVRGFYSVAEHSVRVSYLSDSQDALWGLLHDASEAYLVDIARPIKQLPEMEAYRKAEERLQQLILEKFGLHGEQPESVTRADKGMLAIEACDLMGPLSPGWEQRLDAIGTREMKMRIVRPWSIEESEARFLARFAELYPGDTWASA